MTSSTSGPKLGTTASSDGAFLRPSHIEAYGVHCQEPTCNLSDFLPFKCGHCKQSYCSSHRLPFSHACAAYDESAADVRASTCQWCEQPLRVENLQGRDTDINTAMEYHISARQCPVLKGVGSGGLFTEGASSSDQKKKTSNQCKFWKCKNIMWVDIKCTSCHERFCPTHREPRVHKCGEQQGRDSPSLGAGGSNAASVKMVAGPSNTSSTGTKVSSPNLSTKAASTFNRQPSQTPPQSVQNPFSKLSLKTSKDQEHGSSKAPSLVNAIKGKTTNNVNDMSASRRAAREREQAALALQNRAKKGLLSEDEKVKYATLQAMQAKSGNSSKSKDCVIS